MNRKCRTQILNCDSYTEERAQLQDKVCEAGQEWDVSEILGAEGKGVEMGRKALFLFCI